MMLHACSPLSLALVQMLTQCCHCALARAIIKCAHCGENPHMGHRNAHRPRLFSISCCPALTTPNLVINIHWPIQFLVSPPLIPRHLHANTNADMHVDCVCICVRTCMPVNVCLSTWTPCYYCSDFCSPTPPHRSTPSPLSVLVRWPHHRPPSFLLSLCLRSSHSIAHMQGTASCMSTRCTKSLFSTVGHIFVCANLCTHTLFVMVSHYGGRDFLKWWTLLYWLIIFEIQIFLTIMQNQIIYFCPVWPPMLCLARVETNVDLKDWRTKVLEGCLQENKDVGGFCDNSWQRSVAQGVQGQRYEGVPTQK